MRPQGVITAGLNASSPAADVGRAAITVAFTRISGKSIRACPENTFGSRRTVAVSVTRMVVVPDTDALTIRCLHADVVVGTVAVPAAFVSKSTGRRIPHEKKQKKSGQI